MKNIDELLNRYIDNELSSEELKQLSSLLEEDEPARERLRALKAVERGLRMAPVSEAPSNFTARFMQRFKPVKIKASANSFVYWITGIFLVLMLGAGYAFKEVFEAETSGESFVLPRIDKFLSKLPEVDLSKAGTFLQNDLFMLIGAALTIILMISGFLFIEGHKNFRDRFNDSVR